MADLDLNRFEALTFDCYGTLIDWEAGILAALDAVLAPRGVAAGDDELLETYAGHEADAEGGAYLPYREVLARSCHGVCDRYGVGGRGPDCRATARSWRSVALGRRASPFHDHVPAKGGAERQVRPVATAWPEPVHAPAIGPARRHARGGFGATPPAAATPDLTARDMATFAEMALA